MKHLLAAALLLLSASGFSQLKSVVGVIYDQNTNEPLAFTNIWVLNQETGTVSNIEGHFVLNVENFGSNDTIVLSHVGYNTKKLLPADLKAQMQIALEPAMINLATFSVSSEDLTAKQIVKKVYLNGDKNYPEIRQKQRIFYHVFEKVPFSDENQIILKKSDFPGLDENTFNDLIAMLPKEFIEYRDVIFDYYVYDEKSKIVPVQGVSLEETSQKDLIKEYEAKFNAFLKDIEKTAGRDDIYYKFRSGIFAQKMDDFDVESDDSPRKQLDSLYHTAPARYVKNGMRSMAKRFSRFDEENWEFVSKPGKYHYKKEGVTVFNNEMVYKISFEPKSGGLFTGVMYVNVENFAVVQVDYKYDEGKRSEKFKILGIGHAMNHEEGRVIFGRCEQGYYPKFIHAKASEFVSIERSFSIMKKQKRFLFDKELNEFKIDLAIVFNVESSWEMVVLSSDSLNASEYNEIEQPAKVKYKKEYAYTPEMWNDRTVIAPTTELKAYKRKD